MTNFTLRTGIFLDHLESLLLGKDVDIIVPVFRRQFRREQILVSGPDHLVPGLPYHRTKPFVNVKEAALPILQE